MHIYTYSRLEFIFTSYHQPKKGTQSTADLNYQSQEPQE